MAVVTAAEFSTNFGEYLRLPPKEHAFITENIRTAAKAANPNISSVDAMSGILSGIPAESRDAIVTGNKKYFAPFDIPLYSPRGAGGGRAVSSAPQVSVKYLAGLLPGRTASHRRCRQ